MIRCLVAFLSFFLLADGAAAEPVTAVTNVTVLSMEPGWSPSNDMTVLIRDGRIVRLGPSVRVRPPSGATIIAGNGRFLLPGLTDAHAHPENVEMMRLLLRNPAMSDDAIRPEDVYLPYIANGVTQVLNMSANDSALAHRRAIEKGDMLGPRLFLAAMVDGAPPLWPFAAAASTPEAAESFVRETAAAGYDFVKAYSTLDQDTFLALVKAAKDRNIRVVGHIPGRGLDQTENHLPPNFVMVAHAEEFAFQARNLALAEARIPAYAQLAADRSLWLTATLSLNERILEQARDATILAKRPELRFVNPETRAFWLGANPYANQGPEFVEFVAGVVSFNRKFIKAMHGEGVPILTGTDATAPGVVAGSSLHDEFEALAGAGLSNVDILEATTRESAEFLGVAQDRGTVQVGKDADLLLLDADPMIEISNTRRIAGVFVKGRYFSASELRERMEAMAQRYAGQGEAN